MSENAIHCPFCGSLVESGSEFCHSCGASLDESHKTENYGTGYGTPATQTSGGSSASGTAPTQYAPPQQGQTFTQYPRTQTVYRPPSQHKQFRSNSSSGAIALVFAILACVGVLPCIGSIIAIAIGSSAKNDGDSIGSIAVGLGWFSVCSTIAIIFIVFMTF